MLTYSSPRGVSQNFCENFAVPPVLGSEQWMKSHQVVDPGACVCACVRASLSNPL